MSSSNSIIGTEISCRNTPVEDLDDPSQYSIYPNPFNDGFVITTSGYPQGKELSFFIYDVAGKLIDARQFIETYEYQNDNLAKGVYLYELKIDGELIGNGKLVAQ